MSPCSISPRIAAATGATSPNSAEAEAAERLLAKVLTVSDGVVHGTREDASGAALVAQLTEAGFEVVG